MEKNNIILSVAGSGKTWGLCKDALRSSKDNILIITYTRKAVNNISETLLKQNWGFPVKKISIISWYDFLLFHFIYPFQYMLDLYINNISFTDDNEKFKYTGNHYEIKADYLSTYIYNSKLLEYGVKRLESIYSKIYIDEVQDLAGYDIDILSSLLDSSLKLYIVGDPKQHIYSTHNTKVNIEKTGQNIETFFRDKNIKISYLNKTRRCYPKICDYANFIDSNPPLIEYFSPDSICIENDYGVFLMDIKNFTKYYYLENDIKLLKYNKKTNTYSFNATNIGLIKGNTYKKVAIFPPETMLKFFKHNDTTKKYNKKIYIGVTRAISTVIFIVDKLPEKNTYFKKEELLLNGSKIACCRFKNPQSNSILTKNKIIINNSKYTDKVKLIAIFKKRIKINNASKLHFIYGNFSQYNIYIIVFDNTQRDISFLQEGKIYKITGNSKIFNHEEQLIVEKHDCFKLVDSNIQ